MEGESVEEVEVGHDHSRDPEGDDIASGDEDGGRVPGSQGGVAFGEFGWEVGGVWPSEGGEWPEGGGEPGVEDVGILGEAALFDVGGEFLFEFGSRAEVGGSGVALVASDFTFGSPAVEGGGDVVGEFGVEVGEGPDGDTVSPPELTRDAPVSDVFVPGLEGFGVAFGVEAEAVLPGLGGGLAFVCVFGRGFVLVVGHGGEGGVGEARVGDADVPLVGEVGFDGDV